MDREPVEWINPLCCSLPNVCEVSTLYILEFLCTSTELRRQTWGDCCCSSFRSSPPATTCIYVLYKSESLLVIIFSLLTCGLNGFSLNWNKEFLSLVSSGWSWLMEKMFSVSLASGYITKLLTCVSVIPWCQRCGSDRASCSSVVPANILRGGNWRVCIFWRFM